MIAAASRSSARPRPTGRRGGRAASRRAARARPRTRPCRARPISARHATNAGGLHPGVVGEPRQRTEHPEQRRGTEDDAEADQRRVRRRSRRRSRVTRRRGPQGRAGHRVMVGPRRRSGARAPARPISGGAPGRRGGRRRRVGGVGSASSRGARAGSPPKPDAGERDADLAEHLDRDEEAGEQEQHAEELAELEELRRRRTG